MDVGVHLDSMPSNSDLDDSEHANLLSAVPVFAAKDGHNGRRTSAGVVSLAQRERITTRALLGGTHTTR